MREDRRHECVRRFERAAVRSDADKICIAKLTYGRSAIGFAPGPEITPGEATEYRGAPGIRSLTLERIKNLVHRIGHSAGSAMPTSANPRSRSWHASQRPQDVPSGAGS